MDNEKLKAVLLSGEEICLKVKGTSMEPFLKDGEDSVFAVRNKKPPKIGDICFYSDEYGRIIMHRVYKIKKDGYYFKGDALSGLEGPFPAENIIAVVTEIIHNGKIKSLNSPYCLLNRFILSKL